MEDERNTQSHQGGESQEQAADQVEVKDRGFLGTLLGKKKPAEDQEKKQEEELVTGIENVKVSEPETHDEVKKEEEHHGGEKKESLLAKLHRTSSSSSSSSDEEEEEVIDENGEVVKKKKKKGLKEKIKEKLPGHKDHADVEGGEHSKPHVPPPAPPAPVEAHAHHKVDDDHKAYIPATAPATTTCTTAHVHHDDNAVVTQKVEETPEKGLLDKIKEKLPGGHKKQEDAVAAAHAPHTTTDDGVSSPDGKEKKQGLLGKIMDKIPGYSKSPAEEEHKPATAAAGEHKTSSS